MKIALDTRTLETGHRFRGIGVYAAGLIKGLALVDRENEYYFLTQKNPSPASKLIDQSFSKDLLIGKVPDPSRYYWLADQYRLPRALRQKKIDVVHYLNQFAPPLVKTSPEIVTIHDLFGLDNRISTKIKFWAAKRADRIITISEFSKKELIKKAGIKSNKIVVTYCGYDPIFNQKTAKKQSKILSAKISKYFLYTGSYRQFEPRKNLDFLIKIFSDFMKNSKDEEIYLVLTGKAGEESDRLKKNLTKNVEEKVIFTDFISDLSEMPKLYGGAIAMLFPSLEEGFGLPPLEAMASGTPVISSNTSSLPEVVGDGGILLEPKDLSGWIEAMIKVSTDENYRQKLIQAGLKQAQKFSWEKCAQETLAVYREVAK